MKLLLVAGARPNFMKVAPLLRSLQPDPGDMHWKLVHTGQHYDYDMSRVFFEELEIPEPDHFLGAGSGSHAVQTARVMTEFERICLLAEPDAVVVVGDVNSTLACTITAKKLCIKVAHVEAGLRSGDITMPEEINRIVTDSISDYLFVTERRAVENLRKEGKDESRIFMVGNIMIDTLFWGLGKIQLERNIDGPRPPYAVVTLHRPSNVDDPERFGGILRALVEISKDMNVYFPVHPRTRACLEKFHFNDLLNGSAIICGPPLSYLNFLSLWHDAALVLTDSGGLQEETTALCIPCFTIRENTERPITIEEGTNVLVGTGYDGILAKYQEFRERPSGKRGVPALWDGKTAQRIIDILKNGIH